MEEIDDEKDAYRLWKLRKQLKNGIVHNPSLHRVGEVVDTNRDTAIKHTILIGKYTLNGQLVLYSMAQIKINGQSVQIITQLGCAFNYAKITFIYFIN